MALKIGDNFSYQARKPLDARLTFSTIADMVAEADSVLYEGILSYNEETGLFYTFNPNNSIDATLGKWREFQSGVSIANVSVDNVVGSPTEGHLIITLSNGSTIDAGDVVGSDIATIVEYAPDTAYTENSILYLGNQFARAVTDYTSGSIVTTLDDLFHSDPNLVIMSHNLIDDGNRSTDYTYSSDKIEDLLSGVSSSFMGSAKSDATADLPTSPNKGDWVLIEDCTIAYPGQAAISVYNGTSWDISPIPAGTFVFPDPSDDGKKYFRQRNPGDSSGSWVVFDGVDGSEIELKINVKDSSDSTEGAYVPKVGEFVYDSNRSCVLIGDGLLTVLNLRPFYEGVLTATDVTNALGYTPEDSANRGQANGYAPLDANGIVPIANLPSSMTDTYSKTEVDTKDTAVLTSATGLVNTEAATARANENSIRTDLTSHISDTVIHVTQSEKDGWDAKVDPSDLTPYDNHISDTVIHVTQSDKDRWNGMNTVYYVLNKSDLPLTGNSVGNLGYVQVSAPNVTPVVCDTYIWTGSTWVQQDVSQVSLSMTWGNIQARPTSTVLAIDNTVAIAHNHPNKLAIDKIGQSASGAFTFDGQEIGVRVVFLANQSFLPTEGIADTLYVIYEDARVRNYPSISVWNDGAFNILGRGTQDAPPQVGDMSILQNEYFSVTQNSKHRIKVKQNPYFAFLPLEILKEIPGQTNQNRTITDFTDPADFDYDETLVKIASDSHLTIDIQDLPTTIDVVSSQYLSHVDVDLTKYRDVEGIA